MNPETGNFGNLAEQYAAGRRGVPEEVLEYLWECIAKPEPNILDIACGTGLPTRQLAARGARVTAIDIDPAMLAQARRESTKNITYQEAAAHHLPFADDTFDALTVFSAFHWFADTASVQEMRRALRSSGVIFVLNKNDLGDLWEGHRSVLQQFVAEEIPRKKDGYQPEQRLRDGGFHEVVMRRFPISEFYTLPQSLLWMQSMSAWNMVPKELHDTVLVEVEKFCKSRMRDGALERKIEIVTHLGRIR